MEVGSVVCDTWMFLNSSGLIDVGFSEFFNCFWGRGGTKNMHILSDGVVSALFAYSGYLMSSRPNFWDWVDHDLSSML